MIKEKGIPSALIPDDSVHMHRRYSHSAVKPIHGDLDAHHHLPAFTTKAASKQTYYTIRWLVDRDRSTDAYRAYTYFRWLDDLLDADLLKSIERIALLERQQALVEAAYRGDWLLDPTVEEHMLLDLIRRDHEPDSGLQTYIRNMMAVIAFDVHRTGQIVSQQELDDYTRHLAIAVTEVLHHYIGHDQFAPYDKTRYFAVAAAHITHMLRDTCEDIAAGYYNIPHEFLDSYGIAPWDIKSDAYRHWVKTRVQLARNYFRIGKVYLARIENYRARIAGYAYVARFESVLDIIERDNYQLRAEYDTRKSLHAGLKMGWFVFKYMFGDWLAKAA